VEGHQKIRNTFTKMERLSSKKKIDLLFKNGISKRDGCIHMVYLITDNEPESSVQVMFSVSKKLFPRAVDRNLLKRRMREAYRLNKKEIMEAFSKAKKQLIVAFLYIGKTEESYSAIESYIKQLLSEIPVSRP